MLTLLQNHPSCTMYVQCSLYAHGANLLISRKNILLTISQSMRLFTGSASSHKTIQQLSPAHLVRLLFYTTVLSQNEVHDWLKGVLHGG